MTLGAAGLATTMLLTRAQRTTAIPMAAFLAALAALVAPQVLASAHPTWLSVAILLGLPAAFLLGPTLWLSVETLIEGRTPTAKVHLHLLLPGAGALVALGYAFMTQAQRNTMLLQGELPSGRFPALMALVTFVLVLLWVPQSGYYLFRSGLRLLGHGLQWPRRHLMVFVLMAWSAAAFGLLLDNVAGVPLLSATTGALIALIVTWTVSIWALQDRPAPMPAKYERSALSDARASRILGKLDAAMTDDRLFLDPDLTLHRLAVHVGVPRNHVSQALNSMAGESFFRFVNRYRIEAAKPLVLEGTRTMGEIAIEVGFNARSSFYTAFKQATHLTPTAFRERFRVPDA